MTSWSHLLHPERKRALFLSIHLPRLKKPSWTCCPQESHMPESPRVILHKGVWHITFLNVHFTLRQANEVFFFLSSSPLPQKTDSMCHIRKILVLEQINIHSYLVILHMHFLRRIRLHFLLKSLLPWSLVFESFYPVLPEHLSTQSFVLKRKKKKNPKNRNDEMRIISKKHLKLFRLL